MAARLTSGLMNIDQEVSATPVMKRLFTVLLGAFSCITPAFSTTYWVAPYGSDSNSGTASNTPFATPHKAVTASLAPGDTIFIRGGNYSFSANISPGSSKVGTPGNLIKFWAYPGELPVFDFTPMTTSDKALEMRRNYWHVKGVEIKNAPNTGILIAGTGNIIEGCVVHDCGFDGIVLGSSSVSSKATNALILNCDSFRNYGGGNGNNGDGFAGKAGCGPGNVFRGCRAWNNADDGWDFYDTAAQPVVMENCWAFSNGYNLWGYAGTWTGNGNGFKLGGEGTPAEHLLTNCVTFGNRSKGFDHNNGDAGQTMVNCTGYSNGVTLAKPNFSFPETPTKGIRLYNLLINCVSFAGGALYDLDPTTVQYSNSWQVATVTAADFASLDVSVATNPRNADFTLPVNNLFRIAAGSDLIDRGRNVGLPFNGSAPDLGAFEFGSAVAAPVLTLSAPQFTNGSFRLLVNGSNGGGPVVLMASTNLATWTPVLTNAATNGTILFQDSGATNRPAQFYRATQQ